MSDQTGRRGFFKEALSQIIQPVAELLDDRIGEHLPAEAPSERVLLRPPGALPEAEFLEKCHRVWELRQELPRECNLSL